MCPKWPKWGFWGYIWKCSDQCFMVFCIEYVGNSGFILMQTTSIQKFSFQRYSMDKRPQNLVFRVFRKNSPWTLSPSALWMKDFMVLNVFWNLDVYWKSVIWFIAQKGPKWLQGQVFRVRFLQVKTFKKSWCVMFLFQFFSVSSPKALKLSKSFRTLQFSTLVELTVQKIVACLLAWSVRKIWVWENGSLDFSDFLHEVRGP